MASVTYFTPSVAIVQTKGGPTARLIVLPRSGYTLQTTCTSGNGKPLKVLAYAVV
jgi:hypothetical protein